MKHQLVRDDEQIQIVPVAIFLVILDLIWLSYTLSKWKRFSFLLNDHIGTLNYVDYWARMVNKFWAHSQVLSTHG